MAKVSGTASLGMRVGLGHKKGFTSYDSASPFHSITIERELDESLTDEQLVEKAEELNVMARKLVEKKINEDIRDLQKDE